MKTYSNNEIIGTNITGHSYESQYFYWKIQSRKTNKINIIWSIASFVLMALMFGFDYSNKNIDNIGSGMFFLAIFIIYTSFIFKVNKQTKVFAEKWYEALQGREMKITFYKHYFAVDTKYYNGNSYMTYEYRDINAVYYNEKFISFKVNHDTMVITFDIKGFVDLSVDYLINVIKEIHPYLKCEKIRK